MYQQAVVDTYINKTLVNGTVNKGLFNASGRAFPDVSALGVDYAIALAGQFGLVSGTSASSPAFAAIIALINDHRLAAGKTALGFLNLFLYSEAGASALNDVTVGSNPGCASPGFPAAQGWDPVRFPYTAFVHDMQRLRHTLHLCIDRSLALARPTSPSCSPPLWPCRYNAPTYSGSRLVAWRYYKRIQGLCGDLLGHLHGICVADHSVFRKEYPLLNN